MSGERCEAADPLTCRIHGIEARPWIVGVRARAERSENHTGLHNSLAKIARTTGASAVLDEAYQGDKADWRKFIGDRRAMDLLTNGELQDALLRTWIRQGREIHPPKQVNTNAARAEALREKRMQNRCDCCGKVCWHDTKVAAMYARGLFRRDPSQTRLYWYRCPGGKGIHTTRADIWDGVKNKELSVHL